MRYASLSPETIAAVESALSDTENVDRLQLEVALTLVETGSGSAGHAAILNHVVTTDDLARALVWSANQVDNKKRTEIGNSVTVFDSKLGAWRQGKIVRLIPGGKLDVWINPGEEVR